MPKSATDSPTRKPLGVKKSRSEIASERRSEIIDAFIECVRRFGLHGTTVEQVASAANVSRTLIFHYFGDMDSLMRAALERIVYNSVRELTRSTTELPARRRGEKLIEFIVAGEHFNTPSDVVLVSEMVSLGMRDARIGDLVREGYSQSIATKDAELAATFPDVDPVMREGLAYALMCLSESHWHFTAVGLGGPARNDDVRRACRALLDVLERRSHAPRATSGDTNGHTSAGAGMD